MRVYDLIATVAEVTAYDDLEGSVISAGDLPGDMDPSVVSDPILETASQPRDSTVQVVDLELWIDGEFVERANIQGEMTVERDYDNVAQGWAFSCPLTTPDGVFGTPFVCIGPAIGRKSVDIKGVYASPAGEIRIPLITDGIVDNSHREAGESGIIENFVGVDRAGRFDGVKITKQFPPGHGLHRGRVGREIMRSVGETQVSFADGAQMFKEIQIVDGEPFSILAEIFEAENRKLLWDSDGYATNPQVGRIRPDEEIRFSFEERDLLRVATVSLDSVANVITLVIANGTRQKTQEECGMVYTTETRYEYAGPYSPVTSAFHQNVDGSYDAETPADPIGSAEDPALIRKVETVRGHRCDTLVHEITRTWEMNRLEVPRHVWMDLGIAGDTSDDDWVPLDCYTDDDSGVGGGPAYLDRVEQFRLVSVSETIYFYAEVGYELPLPASVPYQDWREQIISLSGDAVAELATRERTSLQYRTSYPRIGQAQGSVTFFSRIGHIEGKIKERALWPYPLELWEDIPPDMGREIWGNGTGVYSINSDLQLDFVLRGSEYPRGYDTLMPWSATVTAFKGDENNFLVEEVTHQWEWSAPDGAAYYYGDNMRKSEPSKDLRLVSSVYTKYSATGPTHTKSTSQIDVVTGEVKEVVETGLAGYLPAIERLDQVATSEVIYQDGERADLAKAAKRTETEQVTVTVPFDFFLTCHMPKEVTVEFPWAENEDELRQMAEVLAQESAAMPVFFTLPANFLIREADPVHLLYRPFDIDHDIRVKKVAWKRAPNQPLLTTVEARLYGW